VRLGDLARATSPILQGSQRLAIAYAGARVGVELDSADLEHREDHLDQRRPPAFITAAFEPLVEAMFEAERIAHAALFDVPEFVLLFHVHPFHQWSSQPLGYSG
jgi:hypothetical protein